jgi:hypothetical protein
LAASHEYGMVFVMSHDRIQLLHLQLMFGTKQFAKGWKSNSIGLVLQIHNTWGQILYIKATWCLSVCVDKTSGLKKWGVCLFRDMETGGIVSYGSVCPIISRPRKRDLKIRTSPSDLHN